jgi:hypothetical protein
VHQPEDAGRERLVMKQSFQTRTGWLGFLSADVATGKADITSGVAKSDVRAHGTQCVLVVCWGLESEEIFRSLFI